MQTRFSPARLYYGLALLLLSGIFIGACESNPRNDSDRSMTTSDSTTSSSTPTDTLGVALGEAYDSTGLAAFRASKDSGFRTTPSPIPDSLRSGFAGLAYFPPAPEFAFRVPLQRFENPEEIRIAATKGDIRTMLRYGTFSFPIDGKICTLTAYKSQDGPGVLFVPFRDATNNRETYGVGRYLDLEEQPGSAPYVLDFNLAYNPYCAYNENYTCPLVPKENILPVEIRAGEKLPPFAGH
jgi:uncharacterized protein (DUF1684 family)